MRLLILLPMALLCGCVSFERMSAETRSEEIVWQAVNAVDALQTYEIGRDPCYYEAGTVTAALIGEHPGEGAVAAWALGTAWLHAVVTTWLVDQDAEPWLLRTWQAISLYDVGSAVYNNHQIGIRIGGDNKYRC